MTRVIPMSRQMRAMPVRKTLATTTSVRETTRIATEVATVEAALHRKKAKKASTTVTMEVDRDMEATKTRTRTRSSHKCTISRKSKALPLLQHPWRQVPFKINRREATGMGQRTIIMAATTTMRMSLLIASQSTHRKKRDSQAHLRDGSMVSLYHYYSLLTLVLTSSLSSFDRWRVPQGHDRWLRWERQTWLLLWLLLIVPHSWGDAEGYCEDSHILASHHG